MPSDHIVIDCPIERTPRVIQLEGIFDVPPAKRSETKISIDLPIESLDEWNIGLIVGPSGSGKTTIAKHLFPNELVSDFDWPSDKSVIDAFPNDMPIREITGILSSVGFSSPPSWLRPFRILSNGEQFRVTLARAIAESDGLIVIDEFTSVVDRNVAQIGSAAVAKAIRKANRRLIAVSCHHDVIDWLQPDWTYDTLRGEFARRTVRRRPEITITVRRCGREVWPIFSRHHYLSPALSLAAICFVGSYKGLPVVFSSVVTNPTKHGQKIYREHRTVCLPDYQGVGIGNALSDYVASLFACCVDYRSTTSKPSDDLPPGTVGELEDGPAAGVCEFAQSQQ